ncbi:MAG: Ig-like domain-containing protein [Kofleriaceae bacterium]
MPTTAQRTSHLRRVLVAALLVSSACGSRGKRPAGDGSAATGDALVLADAPDGLALRVSDGQRGAEPIDRAKLPAARKLSDAEAAALLRRAAALPAAPGDLQAFALRDKSKPPPRTGQTLTGVFPPPGSAARPVPAQASAGELTVLRAMPEGAVPLAPELSVTFSQPMVAVTSQDDAARIQPVKLTPTPPGKWRWLGTRTILFDPETRFPQATTYRVEIPAGTQSAAGSALAAAHAFEFETPPPTIVRGFPDSGPQRLDTPIFVLFDQKIDPQAVLAATKVTVEGRPQALRLVERASLARNSEVAGLWEQAERDEQGGRFAVFRAVDELPKDAQVTVEIGVGTPSAEGPNRTKVAQTFSFRTYPKLKIHEHACGYDDKCPPGAALGITFNNPLDTRKFDAAWVRVTPAIPRLKVEQYGQRLVLRGATRANTTYTVALSGNLIDGFGQTLGEDASLTFRVTDAVPTFYGPSGMVVLDPAAKAPTFDVFTTNYPSLKVRLYRVEPRDYDAFGYFLQNQWNRKQPPSLPGTKVVDTTISTGKAQNQLVETHVDLAPALRGGLGHVIAVVEPAPWKETWDPPRLYAWVQSTKLAVDAFVDHDTLHAFVSDLATGQAVDGVSVELQPYGVSAMSDGQGVVKLQLAAAAKKGANLLTARRGDDVAFVTEDQGWWREVGGWVKRDPGVGLAWYVIDDRKIYKPAEEVHLKGWLRLVDQRKGGDVGWTAGQVSRASYRVTDSQGNQLLTGVAPVSAVGGFDVAFTLPKTPNLGGATIEFTASGTVAGTHYHGFQIEEFRRPEFEVTARASAGPHLVGGGGDVTVSAKYFAGGPLSGADVAWFVTAQQTTFTPPNRDDFIFGRWTPWWGWRGFRDQDAGEANGSWSHAGKTDAVGEHTLHLDFLSSKPAVPMAVTASASVTDVNRQTWSAAAPLLVHPASRYVGLRLSKQFVEQGTPMQVDVIGVDLDGAAALGSKINVHTARLDWELEDGEYVTKEVDPQDCAVVAAADATPCQVKTTEGGQYQVTATIVDDQGRSNETQAMFWVSGGDQPPSREVERQEVQLIPNQQEYRTGDTAELLVQAPFYPAEGLVSWRRSGILRTERISLTGPTTTIQVPILDAMVPNLVVQVDLVGAAARTDDRGAVDPALPKRPAYAVGTINLSVPPKARTLAVAVAPNASKLGPGETATISVEVKDAAGQPVADAETAVIVVDEAVLSLTGYTFGSPVDAFYGPRYAGTSDHYLRSYVKLAQPAAPGGQAVPADGAMPAAEEASELDASAMPMPKAAPRRAARKDSGKLSKREAANAPIAVRTNFNPLAAFAPAVRTGADGKATVTVKMPDNLTRYRVVAIAAAGARDFGKGESAITARLPLMVRPSPPRFLNFGDVFKLPVVVQNQTDEAMTVQVAVRASNAALTDGAGREVVVPANDRVEVQFPAAAELAGTARFQVLGSAGAVSDAAELALPVWTPATTEAFATYGVIDEGAVRQAVAAPGKVVPQYGGLEVTTSSTQLQALTDAFLYLVAYPFECAEQRSSRIVSVAALRDVLTAFQAPGMPTVDQLQARVTEDLARLESLQNQDGGFPFWERGRPSWPYLTVYVTNALVRAKAKGYPVPAGMLTSAQGYLQDIESHYETYYPREVRDAISAFALYTRKLMGDVDVGKAQRLLATAGGATKLSMEANGWLLGTLAGQATAATERQALVRYALNHVSETAGAANFTTSYADGGYLLLASDRRVDAVMLESLIAEQRDLDLIPKLVTGLLAHQKAGRWTSTQENAFVLVALDQYFQTYEKVTPSFVARVWLGDGYAGDHAFRGRTTDSYQLDVPMKVVAAAGPQELVLQKDGAGRMYYRVGMTYAPADLKQEAVDYGFVVERTYEGADDPNDVVRRPDGAWAIKAGARVRVRVTMANENRRYHVALVDPLPAGLEVMNPALAVTGPVPLDPQAQQDRGRYWWWYGPWYEHQNLRDERVEAFAALLWEGVHHYEYVARATTPGTFVVPPTKAEEMYMPETFGRSASDRVIIE